MVCAHLANEQDRTFANKFYQIHSTKSWKSTKIRLKKLSWKVANVYLDWQHSQNLPDSFAVIFHYCRLVILYYILYSLIKEKEIKKYFKCRNYHFRYLDDEESKQDWKGYKFGPLFHSKILNTYRKFQKKRFYSM